MDYNDVPPSQVYARGQANDPLTAALSSWGRLRPDDANSKSPFSSEIMGFGPLLRAPFELKASIAGAWEFAGP